MLVLWEPWLAEPTLPDLVRRPGISIKKRPVCLFQAVLSPDDRHNREFIAATPRSRSATRCNVAGVVDCQFYGDGRLSDNCSSRSIAFAWRRKV